MLVLEFGAGRGGPSCCFAGCVYSACIAAVSVVWQMGYVAPSCLFT